MAKRNKLDIDVMSHMNDIRFMVYRSEKPGVTIEDTKVFEIEQNLAIKTRKKVFGEILTRSSDTPYSFITKRHYLVDEFIPVVRLANEYVDGEDLFFMPDEKQIEIHSGSIGVFDGRLVFSDYEYLTMEVLDDTKTENGKTYFGPVASGLNLPYNLKIEQDKINDKVVISHEISLKERLYWYRIFAVDTSGNISPWSDERSITLGQEKPYIRLERSPDGNEWEHVSLSTMSLWIDSLLVTDTPTNLENLTITSLSSKKASIEFDNPLYLYEERKRKSYYYRARAEDDEGQVTSWTYIDPVDLYIKPKKILIRRNLYNGAASSKDGIDAFTIFTLDLKFLQKNTSRIQLIDDQLSDDRVYGYTFYYVDELNYEAEPQYLASDNRKWKNVILFSGQTKKENMSEKNFLASFEIADRLIEIGEEEVAY